MKYKYLKEYFGYNSFREGQEEIVNSILSGRDTFGIMPTGAGKSLCFQLPALCMEGITLVISPLISLMIDQVQSLCLAGIRGAYLNSALTYRQYKRALHNAAAGMYKIIYVAPERLLTDEFLAFAKAAPISMITVDEAHCVSQWGHDFRPGYLKIRDFIDALPHRPIVSAFTATATERVKEDVVRILGLRDPLTVTTGFDRKNLYFAVKSPQNKKQELLRLLKSYGDKPGIVYCSTRKGVEEVCGYLCDSGISATRYHAGLDENERGVNQDNFIYDRVRVMVATNAFGMGIDKSNVAFVIHYNMPKNMESYYQEAGRAGRDGSEAECTLLFNSRDIMTNRFLIENTDNPELDKETKELILKQDLERLRAMIFYCTTATCLRTYILRYFGESADGSCGKCSNCTEDIQAVNVIKEARIIASCVDELGGRYGQRIVMEVLEGADSEKALLHRKKSSYGVMSGYTQGAIRDIFTVMKHLGYLRVAEGDYPVLQTTSETKRLFSPNAELLIKSKPKKSREKKRRIAAAEADTRLFDKLCEVRSYYAKMQGVPAYIIFSNNTLVEMCRFMPRNMDEIMDVPGVGVVKADKYGEGFLKAIKEYRQG